jgi:2-succinyl-5-enolpyruvyl-6-hydroxy-3-cyclohexene-1-carboxylate synthase
MPPGLEVEEAAQVADEARAANDAQARDDAQLLGEWARLLFGSLQAAGVIDLFISPGSRSTAFTWQALQTRGLRCHAVIDERCAAFAALGVARATGLPAAVLCTSGSAAANYFPAIIEAELAFLPLLVISADRPVEVQHAGAAQAIDQVKLFGDHVRRYFELGLPDGTAGGLLGMRRAVVQAVALSVAPIPGPVHVNVRARRPLEPRAAVSATQRALRRRVTSILASPLTAYVPGRVTAPAQALESLARALVMAHAGAIVLGPLPPREWVLGEAIGRLAAELGFPILAEASSQLRFALAEHELACPGFEWLLGSSAFRHRHPTDVLLLIGALPLSTDIDAWAGESDAARYVLCEHGSADPAGNARMILNGELAPSLDLLCRKVILLETPPSTRQRRFAASVIAAGKRCRPLVDGELSCEPGFAEGAAVADVARCLPRGVQWALGNSLPIRDVDAYVTAAADIRILSQRGANGIDGLVSGAAGSALATRLPTLLLVGDVSFLHDLGGLALARSLRTAFVIVVLDNDGGRIFDQLPVRHLLASGTEVEQFWRTSPRCDLGAIAQAFGIRYALVESSAGLATSIARALLENAATLLQVRVASDSARRVRERVIAQIEKWHAAPERNGHGPRDLNPDTALDPQACE